MDNEKKIQIVNEGRMADLMFNQAKSFIESQKKLALNNLLGNFRAGKQDVVTLSSGIAAICALEDLESAIVKTIKRGNDASHKLMEERNDSSGTNSS